MNLTEAHKNYCQNRALGKSQYESMLIAYPQRKKWKRNSIDCAAAKLEAKAKIKQRIEELRKPAEDVLEANRTKIIQKLVDIGLTEKKVPTTTVTALTKLIDKILPTKNDNKNENTNKTFEDFLGLLK